MSATLSVAIHAAALLTLIIVTRLSHDTVRGPAATVAAAMPPFVWMPAEATGGGSDGGGHRSTAPPRRARAVGRDTNSAVTQAAALSTAANIEPPEDVRTLPVKPMGDAMQVMPGAIASNGVSLGPGDSGAGASKVRGAGLGNKPGDGVGDAVGVGSPGVTAPTLVERVPPKYTVAAMHARIQGTALVECVVQVDGTVTDARIIRSLDRRFGLDEEALTAARRWRFRPGLLHGKPVPVIITIELMFHVR